MQCPSFSCFPFTHWFKKPSLKAEVVKAPIPSSTPTKAQNTKPIEGRCPSLTIAGIVKRQLNTYPADPFVATGTYRPHEFLARQKVILMDLTQRTQFEAAGRMLASSEPKNGTPSIIDESTWDDLALVTGSQTNQKDCVAGQLDKTYTLGGRIFLYGRVARPLDDVSQIKRRQTLIKELTKDQNGALLNHLYGTYEKLQANEKHMVSFWNPKQMLPGRADKYFARYYDSVDKVINETSPLLTAHASAETAKSLAQSTIVTTSAVAMPLFALSLTGILGKGVEVLRTYYQRFAGSAGPLYLIASLFKSTVLLGVASLVSGFVAIASLKTAWEWTKVELDFDVMIHTKMLAVARFYRNMEVVHQDISKNPEIAKNLEHFHKLDAFFKNEKLFKVFKAFDSKTFDGEAGYFFQRGNVLLPWRQLEQPEVRKEFENAFAAISEIDAVLSTAKVFKETNTPEGGKYCFPEFIEDSDQPVLELDNYWHPLVGKTKSVLNSIQLGPKANNPNIVVTGLNTGGKSTSLRSITSCVVTGQSLGIAAADRMAATVFSRVKSCMHTADNVASGDSLFQAQVKYADRLANELDALPKNKFSLCALDEMFTGTKVVDGASFAYGAAKTYGTAKNSITMFATHFMNVPKLAQDPQARYTNFRILGEAADGAKMGTGKSSNARSLYKLVPGVSEQHAAIAVAKKLNLHSKMLAAIEEERAKLETTVGV